MTWRFVVAVVLALAGVLGPAISIVASYGADATLKSVGNGAGVILHLALLLAGSIVCCLVAAILIRSESEQPFRRILRDLRELRG